MTKPHCFAFFGCPERCTRPPWAFEIKYLVSSGLVFNKASGTGSLPNLFLALCCGDWTLVTFFILQSFRRVNKNGKAIAPHLQPQNNCH